MIKVSDSLRKISQKLKLALGNENAAHIEAGFKNDDLTLTCKGEKAVLNFLAEQADVKAHLTAEANREIKEAEEEKSKK